MFDQLYDEVYGTSQNNNQITPEEVKKLEDSKKKKEDGMKKQSQLDNIVTLKNIDLKVKKGELVFIVGKIGSGKSSLLSALIGDLLPVSQK